jgi:hypothetical protein
VGPTAPHHLLPPPKSAIFGNRSTQYELGGLLGRSASSQHRPPCRRCNQSINTATAAGSTILESVVLSLSATGLTLFDPSAAQPDPAWSIPHLRQPVAALHLLDTDVLALIEARNATLWSSLDRPIDTLLYGQPLRLGTPLTSSASQQDLSPSAYRLFLTPNDVLLQWATNSSSPSVSPTFLTYWALSSDPATVQQCGRLPPSIGSEHAVLVGEEDTYEEEGAVQAEDEGVLDQKFAVCADDVGLQEVDRWELGAVEDAAGEGRRVGDCEGDLDGSADARRGNGGGCVAVASAPMGKCLFHI